MSEVQELMEEQLESHRQLWNKETNSTNLQNH